MASGFGLAAKAAKSPVMAFVMGLFVLAACFCAYFFRNPARMLPTGKGLVLCPAYGRVMDVTEGSEGGKPVKIVRVFLSVFNAHLQISPVDVRIQKIAYVPGKFLDARDPKAAFENEQNRIEIAFDAGTLVVTQIAGLIARRIVCYVKEGQAVEAGQMLGLIRFGSQVDISLPITAQVRVQKGDVVSPESVLAALH